MAAHPRAGRHFLKGALMSTYKGKYMEDLHAFITRVYMILPRNP